MNNEIDLLEELEREERGERLAASGSGAGAAIGVALTLLIGCGLVFAAYKLGQRKNVDGPPLLAAADGPIKTAPDDPGGSPIPQIGNAANAMIDGERPSTSGYAIEDGVVVEAGLPERDIDPAATLEAREIRREIVSLDDLPDMPDIEGQPALRDGGAPDRGDEQMIVAGAEVAPGGRPVEGVLAASAEGIDVPADGEDVTIALGEPEPTAVRTSIAEPEEGEPLGPGAFAEAIIARIPTAKPALGPSVARAPTSPDAEEEAAPRVAARPTLEPAVASRVTPPPAPPGQGLVQPVPQVPTSPGVRRVAIPPQPFGDAQVQIAGAFGSPNEVRGRWSALRNRHRDLLAPFGVLIQPSTTPDGRQVFQMRVGPLRDAQMAAQLCNALRTRGVGCVLPERRR